jgi:VanZ like protein
MTKTKTNTKTKNLGSAAKTRRSPKRKRSGGSKKRRRATTARRLPGASGLPALIPAVRALAIGLAVICLAVFCYWAGRVTFTPIHDHGQAVGNTRVGHSLRFYLDRPSIKEAVRQVGGNLALLAPLGLLLPVVFPRLCSLSGIVIAGALASVVVETLQGNLVPGRAFDIDDVILNVVGVMAAYLLAGRRIATLVRGRAGRRQGR